MSAELLTVYEVAEELKVNQQTVRNWIDRSELSAVRVGPRRVRVRRDALDDFIEDRDTAPEALGRGARIAELERQVAELTERIARLETAAPLRDGDFPGA